MSNAVSTQSQTMQDMDEWCFYDFDIIDFLDFFLEKLTELINHLFAICDILFIKVIQELNEIIKE